MQIEVIRFSLAEGVDAVDFARVNDRYQEDVAYQSGGLARRTVARDDAGRWLDIRLWSDASSCDVGGDSTIRRQWDESIVVESREIYKGL